MHKFQLKGMLSDEGISSSLSFLQQFAPLYLFGWFLAWYMMWAKRLSASIAVPVLAAMSVMAAVILYFTFGGKALAVTLLSAGLLSYGDPTVGATTTTPAPISGDPGSDPGPGGPQATDVPAADTAIRWFVSSGAPPRREVVLAPGLYVLRLESGGSSSMASWPVRVVLRALPPR